LLGGQEGKHSEGTRGKPLGELLRGDWRNAMEVNHLEGIGGRRGGEALGGDWWEAKR